MHHEMLYSFSEYPDFIPGSDTLFIWPHTSAFLNVYILKLTKLSSVKISTNEDLYFKTSQVIANTRSAVSVICTSLKKKEAIQIGFN